MLCWKVIGVFVDIHCTVFLCYSGCEMADPSDDKFTLAGGDAEFGSRAQNVFAGLESLEAQHVAVESSEAAQRESYALMKPDPTDDFFSNSSGPSNAADFQVPSRPPPKRIRSSPRPGYETSPSKWKRYDLSDVSDSQLSEHSNRKAADEFFKRFQVRPDDAQMTDSVSDTDHDTKHIFRKPDKKLKSKDNSVQPVDVKNHGMEAAEDDDNAEDVTRTQILSFADDKPIRDDAQTVGSKVHFRRRCMKPTSTRRVRNQLTCSDDDEEENISCTAKTEGKSHDNKEIPSPTNNSRLTADSESDTDDFGELDQMGSDTEQLEEDTSDTESHPHHVRSASEAEKYVQEDVDLDSID